MRENSRKQGCTALAGWPSRFKRQAGICPREDAALKVKHRRKPGSPELAGDNGRAVTGGAIDDNGPKRIQGVKSSAQRHPIIDPKGAGQMTDSKLLLAPDIEQLRSIANASRAANS